MNTAPDLTQIQDLYLWEEGNAPAQTEVTRDGYDPADFCPYVTAIPVRAGTEVKGAVVLLAGGAFQARANYTDTLPTAAHLRELGFQTFIVDYRLRPYTQQEGALDVARAVRFIRKNADAYDIDPDDIAVMGYSAGGIQAGEFFLNFDEDVLPTALDSDYIPDELDEVAAHASAAGIIYSFYGRLSVASMDAEELRSGDLPPTFYCYGTEDPFYRQFEAQYDLMQDVGVLTKRIVLQDWPHGFGGDADGWRIMPSGWSRYLRKIKERGIAMKEELLKISENFWDAMEHADEAGMRVCADPECNFVHIGVTCKLDQEIDFYTSGAFRPTGITFHNKTAEVFDSTGIVLTDCDYSLLLDGKETTHHFMVTEVYAQREGSWKLVTFSFTALVY